MVPCSVLESKIKRPGDTLLCHGQRMASHRCRSNTSMAVVTRSDPVRDQVGLQGIRVEALQSKARSPAKRSTGTMDRSDDALPVYL